MNIKLNISKRRILFILSIVIFLIILILYFINKVFLFGGFNNGKIENNSDDIKKNNSSINLLEKNNSSKDNNKDSKKQDVEGGGISLITKETVENKQDKNSNIQKLNKDISTVIVLNQISILEKPYVDYLNIYIKNLKTQGLNDYVFYLINTKQNSLGNNSCGNKFGISKKEAFDILQTTKNLDFLSIIKTFKLISKNDSNAKLFIIGDTLSNECNDDQLIKGLRNEIGSSNTNIYILRTNFNKNSLNYDIRMNFYKKLATDLGIQYIKLNSPADFSAFINSKLYPLEAGKGNLINNTINTEIIFFDENGESVTASTIVYQKKGGIFVKYGEFINEGVLRLSLLPGIYYFESTDSVKGIKIKTEPRTINDTLKYKEVMYFRKTKLNVNVFSDDGEPVLSNIKITDSNNGDFLIKEVKDTSAFVYDLFPGSYKIEVKTKDKVVFTDNLIVSGQKTIDKTYKTIKGELTIKVKNEDNTNKDNVFVKVINGYNEEVFNGNGAINTVKLGRGSYTIEAIDSSSGNKITKKITLSEKSSTTDVEIVFNSVDITLNVGSEPVMLRFFYTKDYNLLPKDENEKKKLALKNISGSGKMRITLMPGDYTIEIFNFKDEKIGTKNITIDDMPASEYSLIE